MAQQTINIGTVANDGTGDTLRAGGNKVNDNFTELYGAVAAGGTITALTGDVTASGSGSVAATIANGAVTLAKQANMATASVVYRKTAGAGAPEVNTLATLKTDLGLSGSNSGDQTITLTGDVTGGGTGSFATTIANNTVTNAKAADVATATIKGRVTAATGDPEDLTGTQATTLLDTFTTGLKGLAPASGGGSTNFLRADGSWAAPSGAGTVTTSGSPASGNLTKFSGASSITNGDLTGDVTTSGALATTIANDAVTYAKMQNVSATDKLLGRSTAGSGDVEEIACTAAGRALIDDANAAAQLVTLGAAARAPSIQSVASSATVTPTFADDQVIITAQAAALTLANPTGTALDGWGIVVRIKDNGTARAISYGTQYRAIGVTLPTTTVISKTLYLGMVFNNADTKWDVVAVAQEA